MAEACCIGTKGTARSGRSTEAAGIGLPGVRWETGCTFVDYDLDGKLDIAVTSYLEFDRAKIPVPGSSGYCLWKGMPVMCGPRGLPFSRNRLLRNLGGGKFADVSESSGFGRRASCYAFTVVATDVTGDGYPDLYIACDSTPSLLYVNRGDGTFEEQGLLAGVALNADGQEQGGMGVAVADYDGDGRMDIGKTNFSDDVPNLYRNNGDGSFDDRVFQSGLGANMQYVGWGIHFLDVDHDGLRDLLMMNGHVYPEAERLPGQSIPSAAAAVLECRRTVQGHLRPGGARHSRRVVIPRLRGRRSGQRRVTGGGRQQSRKQAEPAQEFRRRARTGFCSTASGSGANRDAIGALVSVEVNGRRMSAEIQGASSFISQNDSRLHFGLGDRTRYDGIEVRWPGGGA